MLRLVVVCAIVCHALAGIGQGNALKSMPIHFSNHHITLDGVLAEAVWDSATAAKEFVESSPYPYGAPLQPTRVKVVQSNIGIYIGAYLADTAPDSIQKELSPRDELRNTDYFALIIDPYLDGINGLGFEVSAAGVQVDKKYTINGEDDTWDAVWWSRAQIHDSGWTVEMLLPYTALRFSNDAANTWGINFARYIRRTRELSWWNPIDPNLEGLVNQTGRIQGLQKVPTPLRLSLYPYVSSYVDLYKQPDKTTITNSYNAGLDLKYGINEAFTLDMTLIPDFGQVIFDDQILNLGPFEVQFNENRQFFTEGTELFTKGNVFYSRRIGDHPLYYNSVTDALQPGERIVNNPNQSQLINATKISGRNSNKLGIGFFNAIEAETNATVQNENGEQRQVMTNPLTNYNMIVVDQALQNNSYLTFYNTNVMRRGKALDANVSGSQFEFRDKNNAYYVAGDVTLSQRYPDGLENASLGYRYKLRVGKQRGRWQYYYNYYVESNRYDINDFGFLASNNSRTSSINVSYNNYSPFWIFNSIRNTLSVRYSRLHTPDRFVGTSITYNNFTTFTNFLTVGIGAGMTPLGQADYFEPRAAGYHFDRPSQYYIGGFFSPDYRKAFIVDGEIYYTHNMDYGWRNYYYRLSPRWRVNDKLRFRYTIEYNNDLNEVGYTTTAGEKIIFGQRNRNTWTQLLEGAVMFNPLMNISLRARHYWSKAAYSRFFQLNKDGSLSGTTYSADHAGGGTDHDVNFNAWTIDLGFQWQFAPGSHINLVWKNSIFQQGQQLPADYFDNWHVLWNTPQRYSLSLRLIYFLDYMTLQHRHLPRNVTG